MLAAFFSDAAAKSARCISRRACPRSASHLFVAAANLGLAVPKELEVEPAQVLEEQFAADGHRVSRGAKIAAGHRRRREAEAQLKSATESGDDAGVAASASPHRAISGGAAHEPGVARPMSAAPLGPRISMPPATVPRPSGMASLPSACSSAIKPIRDQHVAVLRAMAMEAEFNREVAADRLLAINGGCGRPLDSEKK